MTKDKKITIGSLKKQLEEAEIDISKWGTGKAKTLTHLKKEVESGESLLISECGILLRKAVVVSADIYCKLPNGKEYRLKEDKQVFNDGRERRRNLNYAVSEKIKPNESPKDAVIRAIQEELGINSETILKKSKMEHEEVPSISYPGLRSQYTFHRFKVFLNAGQFNPSGYVERQSDKSTYFIWEELD